MIRPSRRTVARFLTIALVGVVWLCVDARPVSASGCHVELKPTLGISPESSASLVVFHLATPGALRPEPCPGDNPGVPSVDTHNLAVGREPLLSGPPIKAVDEVPIENERLYTLLPTNDRDRPPRR